MERERERENFPMKSSNLRHCRAAHRAKDWANTRGELDGSGPAHPLLEAGRQVGTARARRQGTNSAPETASSTKPQAGSQLLPKSSWDPGWLTSTRRVAARDQPLRGDTWHIWAAAPTVHPGNQVAGTGEVIKHIAPSGDCALTKHLVAWAAPTWEGQKMQAQLKNLNLSSLDPGSTCNTGPTLDSSPAEQPEAWAV